MSVVSNTSKAGQTLLEVIYTAATNEGSSASNATTNAPTVCDALNNKEGITRAELNSVFTLCDTDTTTNAITNSASNATVSNVTSENTENATNENSTNSANTTNTKTQSGELSNATLNGETDGEILDSFDATDATENSLSTTSIDDPYAARYLWHLGKIGAYDAWDTARVEGKVTIAVLDTGTNYSHPDLLDTLVDETYAKNTVSGETGASSVTDQISHGTHVSGVAGATTNNGVGVAGVSYNANILPVKVFPENKDWAYEADIIEGIDYVVDLKKTSSMAALQNLHVINMSLGTWGEYSEFYDASIQNAHEAGIVIVAAAGNEKAGDTNTAQYPDHPEYRHYPSSYDNTICVSALKQQEGTGDLLFDDSYSNYGSVIDISAPGTKIASTIPKKAYSNPYQIKSGTSQAVPIVSASVALLYSLDLTLTPEGAENILKLSATHMEWSESDSSTDTENTNTSNTNQEQTTTSQSVQENANENTENTLSSLDPSNWDDHYGYGALNLAAAVELMAKCASGEHEEVVVTAKEPTCTEDGLSGGSYCDVCKKTLSGQEIIPAKGHTEVVDPGYAATCTEDGLTDGSHCSVCNTILVEQEEIPATGHSWGDWVITKQPTTTSTGLEKSTCEVCGETKENVLDKLPDSDKSDNTNNNSNSNSNSNTNNNTNTNSGSTDDSGDNNNNNNSDDNNNNNSDNNTTTTTRQVVFRLYNESTSEHLFTTDANEYAQLPSFGWKQEGACWYSPQSSAKGVYRVYNDGLGAQAKMSHHYTTDYNEVKELVEVHGWSWDNNGNPLFYSAEDGSGTQLTSTLPVYRLYNDALSAHHYTYDKTENDVLTGGNGWNSEGIGFYAYQSEL